MCPVSKGFDEYGHYGENNPPIRDMTDEERQRAKEREKANQSSDDTKPFAIVVDTVTDHEDGSAGITVTMSDKAQASVIELGLQFIFTCAAAKVDIQDALDGILKQGGQKDD
jgi:hypothetical protein